MHLPPFHPQHNYALIPPNLLGDEEEQPPLFPPLSPSLMDMLRQTQNDEPEDIFQSTGLPMDLSNPLTPNFDVDSFFRQDWDTLGNGLTDTHTNAQPQANEEQATTANRTPVNSDTEKYQGLPAPVQEDTVSLAMLQQQTQALSPLVPSNFATLFNNEDSLLASILALPGFNPATHGAATNPFEHDFPQFIPVPPHINHQPEQADAGNEEQTMQPARAKQDNPFRAPKRKQPEKTAIEETKRKRPRDSKATLELKKLAIREEYERDKNVLPLTLAKKYQTSSQNVKRWLGLQKR
jgi:hypothetical protein